MFLGVFPGVFFASSSAQAEEPAGAVLEVEVANTQAGRGAVRVKLYASEDTFLDVVDAQVEVGVPEEGVAKAVFEGLAPGEYAVVVYYDLNGNRKLDRGLFGIPLEPLGFSNDVVPVFSAPDFEDAAVAVGGERTQITVRVQRFGRSGRADS